MNPRVTKKNFKEVTVKHPERIKQLKGSIVEMKKNLTVNKKSGDIEVKTNIFSIPNEIWSQNFDQFVFDSGKTMTFLEFAENKDNFEFMKEFNL